LRGIGDTGKGSEGKRKSSINEFTCKAVKQEKGASTSPLRGKKEIGVKERKQGRSGEKSTTEERTFPREPP